MTTAHPEHPSNPANSKRHPAHPDVSGDPTPDRESGPASEPAPEPMASHAPTSAAGPGLDEIPNAGAPVPDTAAPHGKRTWLRPTLIAIVATIAIIAAAIAIASAHSHSRQSQYPHTTATAQAPQFAATTVTLSKYYASNMVLQRDVPITIRGTVHVPTTDAAATPRQRTTLTPSSRRATPQHAGTHDASRPTTASPAACGGIAQRLGQPCHTLPAPYAPPHAPFAV